MKSNKVMYGMRGYLFDIHRNALPEINFKGFEREQFRKCIRAANLDNVMLYAKDQWGWAYYSSKVGMMHPKLAELGLDLLTETKAVAEEEGLDVCIYYSVDTDHYAAKNNPGWQAIDMWGKPVKSGGRWNRCATSHGYGDYALAQIKEILEIFHPKGIFLDCFPSVLCFCPKCQQQYKLYTGKDMPLGEEADSHWRELQEYEEQHYWLPYAKKLRTLFDTVSPGTTLTTNGCNANMPKSIRDLYDYHIAEPWAGNYLSAGFSRDIMKNPQIAPGFIGIVYDSTPVEYVQHELLSIGIQGVRPFLYSESMRHDGSIVEHEMRRTGSAYGMVKDVEKYWTDAVPVTDINIVYSDRSHFYSPYRKSYDNDWWARNSNHLSAVQAVMVMAASQHLSYGVLEGDILEKSKLDNSKLLIVPNANVMKQESLEAIAGFVREGGKAVVALDGPFCDTAGNVLKEGVWNDLFGCRLKEVDDMGSYTTLGWWDISSYLQVREDSPLGRKINDFPRGVSGSMLHVEANGAQVLAEFIAPCFKEDLSREAWMAWRPPNPGNEVVGPAILHNRYGKGEVILLCFGIFTMSMGTLGMQTGFAIQDAQKWYWPGILLKELTDYMVRPRIVVEGIPGNVLASYFEKDGALYVHLLNSIDNFQADIKGTIRVDTGYYPGKTTAVRLYPEQEELKVQSAAGIMEIPFMATGLYNVFVIR